MKKIRVAIVGYGNIGQYALHAVKSAPDMTLVGVVRRSISHIPKELMHETVVTRIEDLQQVDVAILCSPTREIKTQAAHLLRLGIHTIDSFDIHPKILELKNYLAPIAKMHQVSAIISAGWDPGTDSIIRALMLAMAPKGITYTNFGPGMSMGHSVAVKAIDGVLDALSMTIPTGTGIHRRIVYVHAHSLADRNVIEQAIKTDDYFKHDETHVRFVDDINVLKDMGHGVQMTHKGVSGDTHNQLFEFNMKINNPALTSQIMVSAARAVMKQLPNAYTLIEIPPIDLLMGERDTLISQLV